MQIFKWPLYLLLSFSLVQHTQSSDLTNDAISKNTWIPRAGSSFGIHDLIVAHERNKINIDRNDDEYTPVASNLIASVFTEFSSMFGNNCSNSSRNLGAMPFWSGTNTMTYGNNDGRADLDAYQFGLGNIIVPADTGIGGVIQLNPIVKYAGADGVLYFTHDRDKNGLYVKAHIPLGAMIIAPHLSETPLAKPDEKLGFAQITLNPNSSPITFDFTDYPTPHQRPQSLTEAFFGGDPNMDGLRGNRPHIVRIRRGRIESYKQTKIRFGDVCASIGYNRYLQKGFASVGAKVSFPTGNTPTADHILEPIVGRAGVWGIGGELSGFYQLWENNSQNQNFNIAVQAELFHLMPGIRPNMRTFDLKQNGPGSKYLLVANYRSKYYQSTTTCITTYAPDTFTIQPISNLSTLPVISKTDVEGAITLMFDFGHNDWKFAIGGECWGRTKEKLCIDVPMAIDMRVPNLNDYAVLGRQLNYYLIDGQCGQYPTYYCEPLAKINKSKDPFTMTGRVPNVYSPATPPTTNGIPGPTDESLLPDGIKDGRLSENRIPEILSDALDICGAAAPSAISGKVFAQIGYTWKEHCYTPTISVVGGAEWARNANVRVNMWNVALQGALSF